MSNSPRGCQRILVALDFSDHSLAALEQAVWVARRSSASLTLVHVLTNFREAVYSSSHQAKLDLFYGEGDVFQREIRLESERKLRQLVGERNIADLQVTCETLVGKPYVKITQAVIQEDFDLVILGSRGAGNWERFFLGSTAQQLIRNCPASVWAVKRPPSLPPKVVLAATDFSDVSLKASCEAIQLAKLAEAEFHLLHVIDSAGVPEDIVSRIPRAASLRTEINHEAKTRMDSFLESLPLDRHQIRCHLTWGEPWKEIASTAKQLAADVLVMGTVGRSGIPGVFLGNTAEKTLGTCECGILTIKPDGFVSPIAPACGPLHPSPKDEASN